MTRNPPDKYSKPYLPSYPVRCGCPNHHILASDHAREFPVIKVMQVTRKSRNAESNKSTDRVRIRQTKIMRN